MRSVLQAITRSERTHAPTPTSFSAALAAPFAVLGVRTQHGYVTEIEYLPSDHGEIAPTDAVAEKAVRQLERYLGDPAFEFTLPLEPHGTVFRKRVWDAIAAIPVGQSRTYGEIARELHSAPRAVGGACGANPIALVIPCHRVVGSRGVLGGFMNSRQDNPLAIKRWLLVHEGYRFGLV